MKLPVGKVKIVFDAFPQEKERLDNICKRLGITKIEFLRRAIAKRKRTPFRYSLSHLSG